MGPFYEKVGPFYKGILLSERSMTAVTFVHASSRPAVRDRYLNSNVFDLSSKEPNGKKI
jgi:hypothetical protein